MHLQIRRALTASVLPMVCLTAFAQKTVTGTVKDAKGEPLIGVTVFVDGKPGSITDIDGNFSIPNASPSSKVKVSYIGYKEQTVTLGNSSNLSIVLQEDNAQLDEVVVVGYGTMKKTDLTGSVSSTEGSKLAAKGTTSAMEALQGSVPGAQITQSSGRTGSGFDIQIRGKSSINGSSSPLYVVDGIICDDIEFLNPQDIERMDILKDASSTAIYGSRATAGVVIVTTKSGATLNSKKQDKVSISYDGYYGVSKIARMPDYMNASQFAQFRFLNFLTSGGQVAGSLASVAQPQWRMGGEYDQCMIVEQDGVSAMKKMMASGETYNWPDLVTQDGQKQNHYISVNGSSKTTNYHFGVGYNREEGVYKNDLQNRYNLKGSLDTKINKYLTAGFSLNLAYTENEYSSDDAIAIAYRQVPFARPYDADGNMIVTPGNCYDVGSAGWNFTNTVNPLIMLKDDSKKSQNFRMLGNVYLQIKPVSWLSFKTTFSPNYVNMRTGEYVAASANRTEEKGTHEEYTRKDWTWDNQVDFNKTFGDHTLGAMALFSMNSTDRMYSQIGRSTTEEGSMMSGTDWYYLYAGTLDKENTGTSYWETKMISYALRLNYSYKGRYMFTGTVRTDGSSKFLKDKRWGWFPSAAVAWRISEESFLKNVSWIDNLKLRLSYGVTGNNTVAKNYNTVGVTSPNSYAFGSNVAYGYMPDGVVNAGLQWEKSHEINLGLDFGFLRNRINGSIDIYQKNATDLLYERYLPLVAGGVTLMDNVGEVQNKGIEIALNTVNIQNKDWSWTTSFNFARNINKVKKINGEENQIIPEKNNITNSLFVGKAVNNIYMYNWNGIVTDKMITVPDNQAAKDHNFTPGEKVRSCDYYNAVYSWHEGMPIIEDVDGNGVIDGSDRKVMGSQDPSWTGNISSTLQYKNWDLSFSIYTKQNFWAYSNTLADAYDYNYRGWNKINMDYYIPAGTLLGCDGVNADGTYVNPVYQEVTHYGSFPFPNAGVNCGLGKAYEKNVYNALAVNKISYWKIKNITLGYTFPKEWLTPWGCQYLRLYVNITNPFVISDYKGFDPEWAGVAMKNDGPSTVTYQIGASIKF